MSQFKDLAVLSSSNFETYRPPENPTNPTYIKLSLLTSISQSSLSDWRAVLTCRSEVDFNFNGSFLGKELATYKLTYKNDLNELFVDNSCTSEWLDFSELFNEDKIEVSDEVSDEQTARDAFVETWRPIAQRSRSKKAAPEAGQACIRFAIGSNPRGSGLDLELQCLPASKGTLEASIVTRQDNCPAIVLDRKKLNISFFRGSTGEGPKPILFSDNQEEVAAFFSDPTSSWISGHNPPYIISPIINTDRGGGDYTDILFCEYIFFLHYRTKDSI